MKHLHHTSNWPWATALLLSSGKARVYTILLGWGFECLQFSQEKLPRACCWFCSPVSRATDGLSATDPQTKRYHFTASPTLYNSVTITFPCILVSLLQYMLRKCIKNTQIEILYEIVSPYGGYRRRCPLIMGCVCIFSCVCSSPLFFWSVSNGCK